MREILLNLKSKYEYDTVDHIGSAMVLGHSLSQSYQCGNGVYDRETAARYDRASNSSFIPPWLYQLSYPDIPKSATCFYYLVVSCRAYPEGSSSYIILLSSSPFFFDNLIPVWLPWNILFKRWIDSQITSSFLCLRLIWVVLCTTFLAALAWRNGWTSTASTSKGFVYFKHLCDIELTTLPEGNFTLFLAPGKRITKSFAFTTTSMWWELLFLRGHVMDADSIEYKRLYKGGNVDGRHPRRTGLLSSAGGFHWWTRSDVCLLSKSLYGLKQAPRAWFKRFASFAITIGFSSSRSDASLFILRRGTDMAYLLLYVDDIVLSASSPTLLRSIVDKLQSEFAMKDMGALHYFLGIRVQRTPRGFFLSQSQYAEEILQRAGMVTCKPASTPRLNSQLMRVHLCLILRSFAALLELCSTWPFHNDASSHHCIPFDFYLRYSIQVGLHIKAKGSSSPCTQSSLHLLERNKNTASSHIVCRTAPQPSSSLSWSSTIFSTVRQH